MLSSHPPATDPKLHSTVPEHPHIQAVDQLGEDPHGVRACLDEFDASLARRAQRRRAATRHLVAQLYARDGVTPSLERIDAEAQAACAQEQEERLAAELRRLVTPRVAAVHRARTLTDQELDDDCQAALNVLATEPRSLAEFQPEAEQRHTAEQALLAGFATKEADLAGLLEEARGWQLRRRRRLRRELAKAGRGRQAAAHRVSLAAVRLAAVQLREAQRGAWLAQPEAQEVLGVGAAALRELHDRTETLEAATVELSAIDRPMAPGPAR
jgi:hypothetical protein